MSGQPTASSPHDSDQSVPDRFRKQAERYADKLALQGGSRLWTYRSLDRWTDNIAGGVLEFLSGPPEPVAVIARDRATAVACAIAVLKAGQIVLYLDPAAPVTYLRTIMEEAGARLVAGGGLSPVSVRSLAAAARLPYLDLDDLEATARGGSFGGASPAIRLRPCDPAAILFTSGSTDRPKAVAYSHRNILRICLTNAHLDSLTAVDRRLLVAAPGTSMGLGAFDALLNGAALFPYDFREGLTRLRQLLEREGITVLHSVPAVFRALARGLQAEDRFPHLRLVRLGGDEVRRADVELFRRCFREPCLLRVGYASAEAGLIASHTFGATAPPPEGEITAGFPVAGVEVRILDGCGGEVAPGEEGEIAVRSPFLSEGYWRRPDVARELCVPAPGGETGCFRRTGDRGRLLPDGRLHHLGRSDSQVKIRGRLVEIAEVETALRAIPGVAEAAAAVHPGASGEERLTGYLVWSGQPAAPGTLRAALGATLQAHLVPSAFVALPHLPLTPAGKIDRHALPPPGAEGVGKGGDYVGPRDEFESRIAVLWENLLGVLRVDVRHDFFDLGGDSILVVEFAAELWRATGRHLPLSVFAHASSIERLAHYLRAPEQPSHCCLVPFRTAGTKPPLFLIHPLGGEVLMYRALVGRLKIDRPVFGLRRDRFEDERPRYTLVEDMAEQYIENIRTVQPVGPYHVCGLSFGAVIAFEVACQLRDAGEDVRSLILLDPATPGDGTDNVATDSLAARCRGMTQQVRFHWAALKAFQPGERLGYLWKVKARHKGYGRWQAEGGHDSLPASPIAGGLPTSVKHRVDPYFPRVYPGRTTLILTHLQPAGRDRCRYWSPFLAQGMEVRVVPGLHSFMVTEPFVRILATQVEDCLSATPAGEGAPEWINRTPDLQGVSAMRIQCSGYGAQTAAASNSRLGRALRSKRRLKR